MIFWYRLNHFCRIKRIPEIMGVDEVLQKLKVAAEEISKALTYGLVRKL